MRRSQGFVLAGQRRGGHLRDHESGIQSRLGRQECRKQAGQRIGHLLDAPLHDSAECGNRNHHLVCCHCQRLPVKISAADNIACCSIAHKHQRIVGGAVQFHRGDFARLRQSIAHCAVHLRRAAQTVGILDAGIFFCRTVRLTNLAAVVQVRQVPRRRACARISAGVHDSSIESARTAAECIEREGSSYVPRVNQDVGFAQRQAEQREHSLRAVQQGEAFFGFQLQRSDARALHCFTARQSIASKHGLSFADDNVRQMSQWGKIAGSAHGTL